MRRVLWLLAALCLLLPRMSPAEEAAPEHTEGCAFTASGKHDPFSRLTDGGYQKPFCAEDGALVISAPTDKPIGWVYLCFYERPDEWTLEARTPDGWLSVSVEQNGFAHVALRVPESDAVRVRAKGGALRLTELRVFGPGALPDDVQLWQPAPEKADLLLLVAHPDDELLFFGGLIPWYASQGKAVVVSYMTCRDGVRLNELLNGLWRAGLRTYPVVGTFKDRSTRTLEATYDVWTREQADCFVVKLIRRFRPEVMVTHDVDGEYGHGAHMACADIALRMFEKAADPMYLPQVSAVWGAWQPKKLYLHLWPKNTVQMDWARDVGGETAIARAVAAFAQHPSQSHFHVQCRKQDRYDCASFGLAKTTVGADTLGGDFFENVP